jgi:hypothetical protein
VRCFQHRRPRRVYARIARPTINTAQKKIVSGERTSSLAEGGGEEGRCVSTHWNGGRSAKDALPTLPHSRALIISIACGCVFVPFAAVNLRPPHSAK